MTTRAEHIRWCKQRAREYLDAGDPQQAVASMASDLGKHEETRSLGNSTGMLAIAALMFGDPMAAARKYVEGFAE